MENDNPEEIPGFTLMLPGIRSALYVNGVKIQNRLDVVGQNNLFTFTLKPGISLLKAQ